MANFGANTSSYCGRDVEEAWRSMAGSVEPGPRYRKAKNIKKTRRLDSITYADEAPVGSGLDSTYGSLPDRAHSSFGMLESLPQWMIDETENRLSIHELNLATTLEMQNDTSVNDLTPSERIGLFYTLNAATFSPRLLSGKKWGQQTNRSFENLLPDPDRLLETQLSFYEVSMTAEDDETASPAAPSSPIPGLAAASPAPPERSPSPKRKKLHYEEVPPEPFYPGTKKTEAFVARSVRQHPVSAYDNWDYEMYDPLTWVEVCRSMATPTHAKSQFYAAPTADPTWEPCSVVGYDRKADAFVVEYVVRDGKKRSKLVKRLNLMFDLEDEKTFMFRRKLAEEIRQEVAAQMRKNLYIEKAKLTHFELPDEILQAIVDRLCLNFELPRGHLTELVTEVREAFGEAMKVAVFDYCYLDPVAQKRLAGLRLPSPLQDVAAPLFGRLQIPDYDLENAISAAALCVRNRGEVIFTMNNILDKWKFYSGDCLLDLELHHVHLPMVIADFKNLQQARCANVLSRVVQTFIPTVSTFCTNNLDALFEEAIATGDHHDSDLRRFLRLLELQMQTMLRECVSDALSALKRFLSQYERLNDADIANIIAGEVVAFPALPLVCFDLLSDGQDTQFSPSIGIVRSFVKAVVLEMLEKVGAIPVVSETTMGGGEESTENQVFIKSMTVEDEEVKRLLAFADNLVEVNLRGPQKLREVFDQYMFINGIDPQTYVNELVAKSPSLDDYRYELAKMNQWMHDISVVVNDLVDFNLFQVNCSHLKEELVQKASAIKQALLTHVVAELQRINHSINAEYEDIVGMFATTPLNPEELGDLMEHVAKSEGRMNRLEQEIKLVFSHMDILEDFNFYLEDDSFEESWAIRGWPAKVVQIKDDCLTRADRKKVMLQKELSDQQEKFQEELDKLGVRVAELEKLSDAGNCDEYAELVRELEGAITEFKGKGEVINRREVIFGWQATDFIQLTQYNRDIEPFSQLWLTASDTSVMLDSWMNGPFRDLDAENMAKQLTSWWKALHKLVKSFKNSPEIVDVTTTFKERIDNFKLHLPLIAGMRNSGMRDRHWNRLEEEIGMAVKPDANTTLVELLNKELGQHIAVIEEVSAVASKEFSLNLLWTR